MPGSDGLLAEAGSGVATLGIPGSAGVTASATAQTIVLPFNDASAFTLAFAHHPDERVAIAALVSAYEVLDRFLASPIGEDAP